MKTKLIKFPILFLIGLLLTGCGHFDRAIASYTGYSTICVNNVEYIQFTSGASVAYSPTGKILTCNEKN